MGPRQPAEGAQQIAVANAPVSYGAFELTVGHDPNVPDGISVLDQVAEAGYAGIDLGPAGYLGSGARLGELLAERGLGLSGAYLELPYADHDALEQELAGLDAMLATFDAVQPYLPGPPPRPTLADSGSQKRRGRPGRSVAQPGLGLDDGGWRKFAEGLARAVGRCRNRGYEPTFHPETGTYVEAPWEIEEVLGRSDVGLCLETGHMMLGGGEPVAMLRDWGERVNHVHLKDAVLSVMRQIVADEAPVTEIWSRATVPFFLNGGCNMAPSFRLGLIGAGRMGRTHLRALAGSAHVAVTDVAEVSAQSRRTLAASGAVVYPGTAEMLDEAAVDGILITAPSDQHRAIIAEVAARGLPILCEKPCGVTTAQTRAAVDTAAAANVPLQVAYWRRYVPMLRALRDQIAAGGLGIVHLVACYQWDLEPPSAAFRAHSGGILIDMGVHEFDQLRWLTGQDINDLHAVASGVIPGGLGDGPAQTADVDSAQVIAELSGGGSGFISLGRYHPAGDMARAEAYGTRGTARCDFLDPAEGERAQLEALRLQAESFAAFASGGRCEGATGADAIAAMDAAQRAGAAIPALSGADGAGPAA